MRQTAYLRDVQYATPANLDARANLHRKYGRGDWFSWLAEQIRWPLGARVLEVGCGPGWFWEAAAARLPAALQITLTDLSEGMVATAAQRVRAANDGWRVAARQADAADLPFASESFDIVVASHMLYHVPVPALAIGEIARVLAPGGVAVVATNGLSHLKAIGDIEAQVWPQAPRNYEASHFGLENGGPMLQARFDEVDLRRYHDDLVCTDVADVEAYVLSSPPGSDAGPVERSRLRDVVEAAFAEGGGTLRIGKDVGAFICRGGRRAF